MKRFPMRKIRDVLRLSAEGLSTRQITASLAIGRTTLRGYLDRATELGLALPLPADMSDTDCRVAFKSALPHFVWRNLELENSEELVVSSKKHWSLGRDVDAVVHS